MIQVSYTDTISPRLKGMLESVRNPAGLATVLGRAGANVLRAHFRARNRTANALGGKRTNFWSRVAEAVQSPRASGLNITIPISHPHIAQKVYGGRIIPRKAKNLAIPIAPEGHGRSPRTFRDLTLTFRRSGSRLVKLLGRLAANGEFRAIYILVPSVNQRADPQAMPEPDTMAAALERAGEIYLTRQSRAPGNAAL